MDKYIIVKGWLGGLGMGGQRHIDLIEDMDSVGSGGRFGNGRANIYILENTIMDKSMGGLGMVGQRYDDFMDGIGSGGRVGKGGLGGLGMGGQRI